MNDINTVLPDIRLRFNIDHPSFEECYAFGYECAMAEVSEEENPFKANTKEYDQWQEGWWAGFYGEEPIYDISSLITTEATPLTIEAANEETYHEGKQSFFTKVIEITGVLAASAVVGYQIIDLVA